MAFLDDVIVQQFDERHWIVLQDIRYDGKYQVFKVPAGFVTDFATIPRLVAWLLPRYGLYTRAAILHDWLIVSQHIHRADADGIFRRSMRELGVPVVRRWMMWSAVRTFSLMRHASALDWLRYLLIAPLSLVFVAIPAACIQVWLIAFYLLEMLVWVVPVGDTTSRPSLRAVFQT